MGKNSIVVKDVNIAYGKKRVVEGMNLCITAGKIFGLLGPSGCGKTTLVKAVTGIHGQYTGEITVMGESLPSEKLLHKVGYMAQKTAIYETITGYENLDFFGTLYSLKKETRSERIEELARLVNLEKDLNKMVGNYSEGMKKRLALAMALMGNPEILILDEPTVGIDPLLKEEIWRELNRLSREKNITILMTTHIMDEADRCDEIAIMREGNLLAQGTPGNLKKKFDTKNLEQAFIRLIGEKQ